MYCPKISPDFVKSASWTVLSSTCTVQKSSCAVPILTCTYPQFKLICWKNHHVLSHVESLSCTVPFSTCTVQKSSCYVPVVSSILVSYCPNFNLSIPTFQLNLMKNSSCTVQKFHLILLNRYLVLSHIRLVMSKNCLVLSQFWLVRTQNSTFFVEKVIMYCPSNLPDFVELVSCTIPISTCTV